MTWRQEYTAILDEIEHGVPREPQHRTPQRLSDFPMISPQEQRAFAQTRFLGIALNQALAWGPWRVEERADTELLINDDPLHGRSFAVFFNRARVGDLYAYDLVGFDSLTNQSYDNAITAEIELQCVQGMPYGMVRGLLRSLFHLVYDGKDTSWATGNIEITERLVGFLWEATRQPERLHPFSLMMAGPGARLAEREEEFRHRGPGAV